MALDAALLSNHLEEARRHTHDDVVLHVPGTHPLAGQHRGPEALLRFVEASRERTDTGEHIEVLDVLEGADHAAAYLRVHRSASGQSPAGQRHGSPPARDRGPGRRSVAAQLGQHRRQRVLELNMSTITLIHETDIDAPADVAWRVVADYARDIEWRNGIVRMEPTPNGPVQVGTTTAEEIKVAGKTYRNNGEVVPPSSRGRTSVWRTTTGAVAHGSRQVTPIDPTRCRVHLELHVTPTGLNRVLAPMLKKVLAKGLAGDLERLANLVRAEATVESVLPRA